MTMTPGPTSGATAVDLSRLPFPALIEAISFEAIVAAAKASLIEMIPETAAVLQDDSEPLVRLIYVFAYREVNLRQRVNDAAKARMLAYAVGSDLDHAALPFAQRLVITPADPEAGAPAVMESDEGLRQRALLGPEGYSVAGPPGAYESFARNASADVRDAKCHSPAPGEVVVTILSRLGDGVPDDDLLELVDTALSDSVRPLTDQVTVQAAEIVDFEVTAEIKTYAGPDSAVVLLEARSRLDAYLADSYRLGHDITCAAIIAALCAPGVQDVDLISPSANVVLTPAQAGHCSAIVITHDGFAE